MKFSNPYMCELNSTPLLNAKEEHDLAIRVADGDSNARDRMLRSNLRLVVNIAKRFAGRGVPLEDLIDEGNLGLIRAVEGFDPSRGVRFSTYATWWIRQSIFNALSDSARIVRVSRYACAWAIKWQRAAAKLTDRLGRTPTHQEVAADIRLPKKHIPKILKAVFAFEHIPQSGPDDNEKDYMLVDNRESPPEIKMEQLDDLHKVMNLLKKMDQREETVIRMRYGLDGHEPKTLTEIGKAIGRTRERVRQIEIRALRKLREQMAS